MTDYTDCPNCGAPVEAAADSCPFCGASPVPGSAVPGSEPSLGPGLVAGRARRAAARAIDLVIIMALALVARGMGNAVAAEASAGTGLSSGDLLTAAGLYVFGGFAGLIYEAVLLARRGQTVGKIALRIKVVDIATGREPGWQVAVLRTIVLTAGLLVAYLAPVLPWMLAGAWFMTIVVLAGSIFFIVVVGTSILFDPMSRGLHDRAARTIVIATEDPSDSESDDAASERLLG